MKCISTQDVQFQGHTWWLWKGSIYSCWGSLMEHTSTRGRWMVPPTWASGGLWTLELPVSFIASSSWFGGGVQLGGHFLRIVHPNRSFLSMTQTEWHQPSLTAHPPKWLRVGVGMMSRGILHGMCRCWGQSLFSCLMQKGRLIMSVVRDMYWGSFSLEEGFRAVLLDRYH